MSPLEAGRSGIRENSEQIPDLSELSRVPLRKHSLDHGRLVKNAG
jgi:hypothetical protein